MDNKHTPGPWGRGESTDPLSSAPPASAIYGNGELICSIEYPIQNERELANIRLIESAPEMLEALENLENDDGKVMPESAWNLVQSAIAKAKGIENA